MTGRMNHVGSEMSESKTSEGTDEVLEREVAPQLPTSGQILGQLVKDFGYRTSKAPIKDSQPLFLRVFGRQSEGVQPY